MTHSPGGKTWNSNSSAERAQAAVSALVRLLARQVAQELLAGAKHLEDTSTDARRDPKDE